MRELTDLAQIGCELELQRHLQRQPHLQLRLELAQLKQGDALYIITSGEALVTENVEDEDEKEDEQDYRHNQQANSRSTGFDEEKKQRVLTTICERDWSYGCAVQ